MHKGFSTILVVIGVLGALAVIGGFYYLGIQRTTIQNTEQNASQITSSSSPSSSQTLTIFQSLLEKNCLNQSTNKSLSGEIALDTLPIVIKLSDLKNNKGICDSDFNKYVNISLGEANSIMTISDKSSYHCCHGPSSLEPAGKLIKTQGDINIYIHSGTWGAGPNSGYKPIVARGVKNFKLGNGEEIKIVLDRQALDKNDSGLQKVEDKYKIIDPNFDSGAKVLTPETVEKMFMDNFFSNFADSPTVKKIENDLKNITLKN